MKQETVRRPWAAACGIAGFVALAIYFAAPAFTGWPYAGAAPADLARYANGHTALFYAGAWLQVTGALLSVLFFLAVVRMADAQSSFAGIATVVGGALLLATVVVEAAFLVTVPIAAAAGDLATVATAFQMSNGVFARIFPLAPAPLLLGGMSAVLWRSRVLHRPFAWSALALAALFELAGIAAIFGTAGLIFAIVMSVLQAIWILAAAIDVLLRSPASG